MEHDRLFPDTGGFAAKEAANMADMLLEPNLEVVGAADVACQLQV